MSSLSREAILTVLSGLALVACDKSSTLSAEPLGSIAAPARAISPPVPAASGAAVVSAQEVAPAQSAAAKKPATGAAPARSVEKSCAPGGCAPGQCGAKK